MKAGVHVSISGSIDLAVDRALERKCDTFQIFTRNPRGWKFKDLSKEDVQNFRKKLEDAKIGPAVAHMPYLPNIASPKKSIYTISMKALVAEVDRCGKLGIPYLVTHLGSHLGKGMDIGLERIVNAVNTATKKVKNGTLILLENTAGTMNSMGSTFQDIRNILDKVQNPDRVAVCFDTCHAFAAGYDLRDEPSVTETLKSFDEIVGLDQIKVAHLNDSYGDLKSGRDRHEHIGLGKIGEKGFRAFLTHSAIRSLPMILETPIDKRRDDFGNLKKVRELGG